MKNLAEGPVFRKFFTILFSYVRIFFGRETEDGNSISNIVRDIRIPGSVLFSAVISYPTIKCRKNYVAVIYFLLLLLCVGDIFFQRHLIGGDRNIFFFFSFVFHYYWPTSVKRRRDIVYVGHNNDENEEKRKIYPSFSFPIYEPTFQQGKGKD